MGVILDRGRRVASYLRAYTGSPLWKFQYGSATTGRGFDSPKGFDLAYMSCKHAGDAVKAARTMRDQSEIAGVVYQSYHGEPDDAVVILPIKHYTTLVGYMLEREQPDFIRKKGRKKHDPA
jgi:hypothetical protein